MKLHSIAIKNLKKRTLSTFLTIFSILLGVSLVISVMVVQNETERTYSQTSVGYDLIFTAKGSQLQATLNTLYHMETSLGIVPISLYETLKSDPRVELAFPFYVGDSYRGFRVVGTSRDFIEKAEPRRGVKFSIAHGRNFERPLEAVLGHEVARRTGMRVGDRIVITHGLTEVAPGAEPHVHDDVPVVITGILSPSGTANDRVIFTDLYTTHALHEPHLFLDDHDHNHDDHQHDLSHSEDHNHGTRAYTDLEGKSESHTHTHSHSHRHHREHGEPGEGHYHAAEIILEKVQIKELDAVLVRMSNTAAALQVAGMINFPTPDNPLLARNMMRDPLFRYKDQIMATVPAMQIRNLMNIVGNAEMVLRFVAWFVVVVALFGVLIGIYNTMDGRKRDIALMRALGARRNTIFSIILIEAGLLSGTGSFLGLFTGHLLVMLAAPLLADVAGIYITAFNIGTNQILLAASLTLAGTLVGLVPAVKAYRTDPVRNLSIA